MSEARVVPVANVERFVGRPVATEGPPRLDRSQSPAYCGRKSHEPPGRVDP